MFLSLRLSRKSSTKRSDANETGADVKRSKTKVLLLRLLLWQCNLYSYLLKQKEKLFDEESIRTLADRLKDSENPLDLSPLHK